MVFCCSWWCPILLCQNACEDVSDIVEDCFYHMNKNAMIDLTVNSGQPVTKEAVDASICSICTETITNPSITHKCTMCNGMHHAPCLLQWYNTASASPLKKKTGADCPLCRKPLILRDVRRAVRFNTRQEHYELQLQRLRKQKLESAKVDVVNEVIDVDT